MEARARYFEGQNTTALNSCPPSSGSCLSYIHVAKKGQGKLCLVVFPRISMLLACPCRFLTLALLMLCH